VTLREVVVALNRGQVMGVSEMHVVNSRSKSKLVLQPIRFGEYLFEKNLINDEQLLEALAHHWSTREHIGDTIGRFGFLSTEEIERRR